MARSPDRVFALCGTLPGMFEISVKTNLAQLVQGLDAFARQQVPFAAAQALTAVARLVQREEQHNMDVKVDRPTPFTKRAVRVIPARKGSLFALVIMQDITAAYMAPYEFGGLHKLIGKGITWFNPKHVKLNQYGNIPANRITRLVGGLVRGKAGAKRVARKQGIFVGRLKGRGGASHGASGVWRRLPGKRLELIVAFGDAHRPNFRLGWFDVANKIVNATFDRAFTWAITAAMRTARRP